MCVDEVCPVWLKGLLEAILGCLKPAWSFLSCCIVSFVFLKGLHLYAEWYVMSVCIFLPSVVAAMYDFIKRIQELTGLRTDLSQDCLASPSTKFAFLKSFKYFPIIFDDYIKHTWSSSK